MRRLSRKRAVRAGLVACGLPAALTLSVFVTSGSASAAAAAPHARTTPTVPTTPAVSAAPDHHPGRHGGPSAMSLVFSVPRDGEFHHLVTANGIAVSGFCSTGASTHASLSFAPTSGVTSLKLSGTWTRDGTVAAVDIEGSQGIGLGANHTVDTALIGDDSARPEPVAQFLMHLVNPSDRSACTGYGLVVPGR